MIPPSLASGAAQAVSSTYPPGSFGAAGLIGACISDCSSSVQSRYYRNAMAQTAGFRQVSNGNLIYTGAFDANGWPTSPARVLIQNNRPAGVYKCQVLLNGTTGVESFTSLVGANGGTLGTGSNVTINGISTPTAAPAFVAGSGGYWTFDLYLTTPIVFSIYFNNATGFANLQVMLPAYQGYDGKTWGPYFPDAWNASTPQSLWTDEILAIYKKYGTIRGMGFLVTNEGDRPDVTAYSGGSNHSRCKLYATGSQNPNGATAGATYSCATAPNSAYATAGTTATLQIKGQTGTIITKTGISTAAATLTVSAPSVGPTNTLTFASTTGVQVGAAVYFGTGGSNRPNPSIYGTATFVTAVTATTVTLQDSIPFNTVPTGTVVVFGGVYTITAGDITAVGGSIKDVGFRVETTSLMPDSFRAKPVNRFQNDNERCVEDLVSLANAMKAAPNSNLRNVWINVKGYWDNACHSALAAWVYANLDPRLNCMVELDNETPWNTAVGYEQWHFYDSYAVSGQNAYYGYAQRFAEVMALWRAGFGESGTLTASSRCRPILGGQTGNLAPIVAGVLAYTTATSSTPGGYVAANVWGLCQTFYSGSDNYPITRPSDGVVSSIYITAADVRACLDHTWTDTPNNRYVFLQAAYTQCAAWNTAGWQPRLVCYEGGMATLLAGTAPLSVQDQAWLDPSIKDHVNYVYDHAAMAGVTDAMCLLVAESASTHICQFSMYPDDGGVTGTGITPMQENPLSAAIKAAFYRPLPARIP